MDKSDKSLYIEDSKLTELEAKRLHDVMINKGLDEATIEATLVKGYGVKTVNELTKSQYAQILRNLK